MTSTTPLRCLASIAVVVTWLVSASVGAAQQPSGATLTPDLQSYLVNKDVGAERWTITLNLFSQDPSSIISITGNIFRADGGSASFVTCLERADSSGDLRVPTSTFRLSCSGASACGSTADACARSAWTLIASDVRVPATFLLPPGGLGSADSARIESFLDRLATRLSRALARMGASAIARGGIELALPRSAHAQANGGRGATLTLDRLNHLVTKDVGNERWSISFSEQPFRSDEGGIDTRFLNVTGNVYQAGGGAPSFVYCMQRPDSTGTLADPASELRFVCLGSDACEGSARDCARDGWRSIASDVRLPASFFLPPDGLPAAPQSDPGIVVIGGPSGLPALIAPQLENVASVALDTPAGGDCAAGEACVVPRIGGCVDVPGFVVDDAAIGCRCLVVTVPPSCIACGDGASGQCGGTCEFPVGDATARGVCLPFDAGDGACACHAIGAGEELTTQGCGSVLGVSCEGDRCCTNDPRGSCDPLGGEVACPGVCVAADGCDPETDQCGSCFVPPPVPTATPQPTPTHAPTATPSATPAPTATAKPSPSPIPSPTPDPICLGAGEPCSPVRPPSCCSGLVCILNPAAGSVCAPG